MYDNKQERNFCGRSAKAQETAQITILITNASSDDYALGPYFPDAYLNAAYCLWHFNTITSHAVEIQWTNADRVP